MPAEIPTTLKLRDIKYGAKSTPADRSRAARVLLAEGRTAEALDLFMLAEDAAGVAEIRKLAIHEGRPLLLIMMERAGDQVSASEWKATGEACAAAERWREAFRCFTLAGDEAAVARVQEKIPDFQPYTPQGK